MLILASPGRIPLCVINGIDEQSVSFVKRSNNTHTLSFDVHKYIEGELTNGYQWIEEQMELYYDGIWFNINYPPSVEFDSYDEIKTVTAESDEIKLQQYMLTDFAINIGEAHSYEYMYKQEHDPDSDNYYQVKFYDENNPALSLLHIILAHAEVPGWKIGYVDNITVNSSDSKTFLPDEICYFDIEEQSVYSLLTQEIATTCRCVFEFDTMNMLINVYRAESLGKDTNVLLDFNNVQNSISISRDSQLITVFNVSGEDDVGISYVNPVGGSLIEDLTYYCKYPYMTNELAAKYKAWIEMRDSYVEPYYSLTLEYHKTQDIITELTDRVPADSVENDWTTTSEEDLQEAYNANIAIVKGLEAKFQGIDGLLDLDSLKASEDWALYESIQNYTIPSIVAALQNKGIVPTGTTDYGFGNYIQNPVPVSLGTTWHTIGSGAFSCEPLDSQPDYGMNSSVKIVSASNAGIKQKEIKTSKGTQYCISVYVKPTSNATIQILHQDSSLSNTLETHDFDVDANTWQRIYCVFTAGTALTDVIFQVKDSGTVCFTGMQLELGDTPKLFTYYIYGDTELKSYETDWKLYGVDELDTKLTVYQNNVDIMTSNGYSISWSDQSSYDEPYHTQLHQKYLDYVKLLEDCKAALEERITERKPYELQAEEINKQRIQINQNLQFENFGSAQDVYDGFTEKEIFILNSLRNQQSYTNPNIISTSLTTMEDIVYIEKELYDDAMDRLYVESHPQYTYSDSVDNVLALPEFEDFHGELDINNFIRIAIDDSDTYVKLRVIEITSNPFTNENDLQIVFSNTTNYRAKRDDLAYLIDETANASSKGQIVGNTENDVTNYILTPEVITKLFSSSLFQSSLNGATVGSSGSGGNFNAEKIVAELVKADEGIFDKITSDTGFFKYIDSYIINSSELYSEVAEINKLLAGTIEAESGRFIYLTADTVKFAEAFITTEIASHITVADLATHSATAEQFVLISENGAPGIAFQNSTQQFYDSSGNIRVQIGQDDTGNFTFCLYGADGNGILIDETGIKASSISNGLIVNDMIQNATISNEKLSFKVDVDDEGHVLTSSIYQDGRDFWSIYSDFVQDALAQYSKIEQNAKAINMIVSSDDDYSSFTLTDSAITAITNQFIVKSPDGNQVIISNGLLSADALKSNNYSYTSGNFSNNGTFFNLSDGSIISKNLSVDSSGNATFKGTIYATSGEFTGSIKSGSSITCGDYFSVTSDGIMTATNGYFSGTICATSGEFTGSIKSGSTITCGSKFSVTSDGTMTAIDGNFSGTITCGNYFKVTSAGYLTASSGTVGGWTIGTNSLYNGTNSIWSTISGIYLGTDGIRSYNSESQYVNITNGQITACGANIKGDIVANSITANQCYSLYFNDTSNSSPIIGSYGWGDSVFEGERRVTIGLKLEHDGYGWNLTSSCPGIEIYINNDIELFNSVSLKADQIVFGPLSYSSDGASGWFNAGSFHADLYSISATDTIECGAVLTVGTSLSVGVTESEYNNSFTGCLITSSGSINTHGNIILDNSKRIFGYTTNGDLRTMIFLNENNNVQVGYSECDVGLTMYASNTVMSIPSYNSTGTYYSWKVRTYDTVVLENETSRYHNQVVFSGNSNGYYFQVPCIYTRKTSASANVYVNESGTLARYTSASKYKLNIKEISEEDTYAYNALKLSPMQWNDKFAVEQYASYLTKAEQKNTSKEDNLEMLRMTDSIEPQYGLIAEHLEKAGLSKYCQYTIDDEGNKTVEGIMYDRLCTLALPISRDLVFAMQIILPIIINMISNEKDKQKLQTLLSKFNSIKEEDIITA